MQRINKKNRFNTFNIVDLLISAIILVVVALLAYIFFFGGISDPSKDTVKIEYTLEVREVRQELVDNAKENLGKKLIEGTAKYNIGEIVDFYSEPSTKASVNLSDGSATVSEYPNHANVNFIVNANANVDPVTKRYSVNGYDISVGTLVYLRLPYFTGTAYCTAIAEIPNEIQ